MYNLYILLDRLFKIASSYVQFVEDYDKPLDDEDIVVFTEGEL